VTAAPARVAVIVPCHNYGRFLRECVGSLASQTFADWECMIVDDGSTDDTRTVATGLTSNDPRIRYLWQERQGPSTARNTGLSATRSDYVQLLDADDMLEPDKLRAHIEYLDANPDVDIVYGDATSFGGHRDPGLISPFGLGPPKGRGLVVIERLIARNPLVVEAPLFRRSVLDQAGAFSITLGYLEDWDLWTRCALAGVSFAPFAPPNTRALVRIHSDSMSSAPGSMLRPTVVLRRRFAALPLPPSARAANQAYLARAGIRLALFEFRRRRLLTALVEAIRAIPHVAYATGLRHRLAKALAPLDTAIRKD
jgi:GT2 family glycosyltransferase